MHYAVLMRSNAALGHAVNLQEKKNVTFLFLEIILLSRPPPQVSTEGIFPRLTYCDKKGDFFFCIFLKSDDSEK